MDGERNYCQQRNVSLRGTVKAGKAGTPKHEYQSYTLLKGLLRMCNVRERGTSTSPGRSNIFYMRFMHFLLIIGVTKMYCWEANHTTRTQFRVPCNLLHVKYSLCFFLNRKGTVAASQLCTVPGRLKTETLESRSRNGNVRKKSSP